METQWSGNGVGKRIAEFGQSICGTGRGWQSDFARKLGMTPANLRSYMLGVRNPGTKVYEKLEALGADTYFIRNGRRRDEEPVDTAARAVEIARKGREEAMRDGVDGIDVIAEDVKFHIASARTPQQRARLPYLRMLSAIISTMKEQLDLE